MTTHKITYLFPTLFLLSSLCGASHAGFEQTYPDVIAVEIRHDRDNWFDFSVTLSSTSDSEHRYADGFRVTGKEQKVYCERKLWHDHAGEQPFTKDLNVMEIPLNVKIVYVQARDQKFGYGGRMMEIQLPGRN